MPYTALIFTLRYLGKTNVLGVLQELGMCEVQSAVKNGPGGRDSERCKYKTSLTNLHLFHFDVVSA